MKNALHVLSAGFLLLLLLFCSTTFTPALAQRGKTSLPFFTADNKNIQYTGRIDFTNVKKPKFWAAGVYFQLRFKGTSCEIFLDDEVLWGNNHNYLEIIVDNDTPYRIQTTDKSNTIIVGEHLSKGEHTVTICKNTEAGIGYLELTGVRCAKLLPLPPKPLRRIEFIGNSITCGTGSDLSKIPCDSGQWYDQHNAYLSYGPTVARKLNAQWQLTSLSGIGLIHSCCNMDVTMPDVFDKISLRDNKLPYNFDLYQPDVVTMCLGQNDGIQDSTIFCNAYVKFIKTVRGHYPNATIVLLSSPMADAALTAGLKKYLTAIVNYTNASGDSLVHTFFFSKSFNHGCGGHPDLDDHKIIAEELSAYLKSTLRW